MHDYLSGHEKGILSVVYSPDGKQLATGSGDSTVKLWDVVSGECEQTLLDHGGLVTSVVYSPDGKQLATGSYDGTVTVKLWDVVSGECEATLDDRVYAGLDITGAIGLTPGSRTALKLMGAVDSNDE